VRGSATGRRRERTIHQQGGVISLNVQHHSRSREEQSGRAYSNSKARRVHTLHENHAENNSAISRTMDALLCSAGTGTFCAHKVGNGKQIGQMIITILFPSKIAKHSTR
jgi:hypothetical protein